MGTVDIRTPDQRLRVFISSTLGELAEERAIVRDAIRQLRLTPVMFEAGARPHPPRDLYRSYLAQSDIFVGIYWNRYGWIAPEEEVSGLEDEYVLSGDMPKLIYVKGSNEREPRLVDLLRRIRKDDRVSYKPFSTLGELRDCVQDDLAIMLTERFTAKPPGDLATSSPTRRDLPVPPTPFVGREREEEELVALLDRDDVRLLTIMGPGGIGKSRLALRVAERIQDRFPDGIAYVLLASVGSDELVGTALARSLDLVEASPRPLIENIKDVLRDKQMLLLLDNFEHVLGAAPLVAEILTSCPGVKVLVTSRSALNLRAEHEYQLPPMSLAEGARTFEEIASADAVRLFEERAVAANRAFRLTEENAAVVAQIVEKLDGLPLGIELAAARSRLLPPDAMLPRLWKRLELLKGGHRDLPERQRTLRATIDWDYDLLTVHEQIVFRRVAVLAGSFHLAAAAEIVDAFGISDIDVLEVIDSLVHKSLLNQVNADVEEPRFSMLKTLREYAFEKLEENEETEGVRACHAEGFLSLVERAEEHIRGADQAPWLDILDREHDNLRAAMQWYVEAGELEKELRFVSAMAKFWEFRSHLSEGQRHLTHALSQDTSRYPELKARCLEAAGVLALGQVDLERAEALMKECVKLRRSLDDRSALATSIKWLGNVYYVRGDMATAAEHFEESLDLKKQEGDLHGVADALNNLGIIAAIDKDWGRAAWLFEEALEIFRDFGDAQGLGRALMNLAEMKNEQGDLETSKGLILESIKVHRELGSRADYCDLFEELGRVLNRRGDPVTAATLHGAAQALRELLGAPLPVGERERYDLHLHAIRRGLSDEEFQSAWDRGARMDTEAALEFALARAT